MPDDSMNDNSGNYRAVKTFMPPDLNA